MNMDSSSSMAMSMPTSTTHDMSVMSGMSMSATSAAAMASESSSMDMGGMGMGMGDGPSCKISMLWNWYTVDACFLSSQWRITSPGMMAGSCIGVILLVMVLEALRRASREYDAYIIRQHMASTPTSMPSGGRGPSESDSENNGKGPAVASAAACPQPKRSFKPSLVQQLVRATLHMCQFAVAYFVMLLAMYFNGYIIICILIGAFLGAFVFGWHSMALPGEQRELTYCCG